MKKIVLAVTCAMAMAATSAQALENTVKPTVTKLGVENPAVALDVPVAITGVYFTVSGMTYAGGFMRGADANAGPVRLDPKQLRAIADAKAIILK